jgi:hypothetical protein
VAISGGSGFGGVVEMAGVWWGCGGGGNGDGGVVVVVVGRHLAFESASQNSIYVHFFW